MKFHELKTTTKNRKRVGRGISAGGGKTAGRGTKGQNSRSGGKRRPGFEGGQNPLYARLPKIPGFRSYRQPTQTVTTAQLANLKTTAIINSAKLHEAGLIKDQFESVKLIFKGEVSKPFKLQLQAASKQATDAVTKAGGSVEIVDRPKQTTKKPKNK